MVDISLVDDSYVLHRPFFVPTKDGAIWAITFTTYGGTILTAGISVILTLVFVALWDLICFIAIVLPGATTRRRHLALVTLWNSNDSWFAFKELAKYAFHYFGSESDFVYGLIFCILAFVIYGGSLSLGIVGPSLMQVGTVAPARPSAVYYPSLTKDTTTALENYGILSPANLRALGSVDASLSTLGDSVIIGEPILLGEVGGENIYQYSYTYSLTGIDIGLQHGSDLALNATGSCTTEYGWISNASNANADVYRLWDDASQVAVVPINPYALQDAPKATFQFHPNAANQSILNGNISYAIVAWSAHRASIKQGGDPWYKTEVRTENISVPFNAPFWIQRSRPALSCWQQDRWTYGSQNVTNIYGLRELKGIKIKPVLLTVLERALGLPVVVNLGNGGGLSALKSASTSPNGAINAEVSSISDDLKRLILASFVLTRNVLLDTTTYKAGSGLDNIMQDQNGDPADGAGDFVLSSPNFQTFSMVGMIVLFVVFVSLFIINMLLHQVLRLYTEKKPNGKAESKMMLFKVLPAAQLFRRVYEPKVEDQVDEQWPCSASFPSKEDKTEFRVDKCPKGNKDCSGHINGELRGPEPAAQSNGGDTTTETSTAKEKAAVDIQQTHIDVS
ncbi:hypothetical protein J3F84DRAFT_402719 [Trichoderma pleuroticola]|uniref:Uncharacterized protein n=1 Tax=Trichoderma harzianum TaxID=5544 RepID=A0A2K0TVT3_TRIHA|nr:hypothetical protein THARTR1_09643 [Trichoderma harzianum]